MSLERIRYAVEMTTQPELSQLLALLIEHGGLLLQAGTMHGPMNCNTSHVGSYAYTNCN